MPPQTVIMMYASSICREPDNHKKDYSELNEMFRKVLHAEDWESTAQWRKPEKEEENME